MLGKLAPTACLYACSACRALLKQCKEAGDALLRIKTGLGGSALASMGQQGGSSPHALAPAGTAAGM
jgi:hypothetical protein